MRLELVAGFAAVAAFASLPGTVAWGAAGAYSHHSSFEDASYQAPWHEGELH